MNYVVSFLRYIMNENLNAEIVDVIMEAGFDVGVAIATQAEVEAGAACGQLSVITEDVA